MVLIGGVVWLTRVESRVAAMETSSIEINSQQKDIGHSLSRIDRRLSRIEGKLGVRTRDGD